MTAQRRTVGPLTLDLPPRFEQSDCDLALSMGATLFPDSNRQEFIVIPGAPHSKMRARVGKGRRVYDPAANRAEEYATGLYLRQVVREPYTGNVGVACLFFRPDFRRLDVDNMLKHILDSANGVCWRDDSQVTAILGLVEYDPDRPRTIVVLGEHTSSLSRATVFVCRHCGESFERNHGLRQSYCGTACRVAGESQRRSAGRPPNARCADCGIELSTERAVRCRPCDTRYRLSPRPVPPGEAHPQARLTVAQVREIRQRIASGETQVAVAVDYGISDSSVGDIATGRTWKHLT